MPADDRLPARRRDEQRAAAARGHALPAWKKLVLLIALLLMLAGLVLGLLEGKESDPPANSLSRRDPAAAAPTTPTSSTPQGLAPKGLAPGDQPATWPRPPSDDTHAAEAAANDADASAGNRDHDAIWSPLLFRLGFSFFVGFCLGYALRLFFKITMILIGVVALALLGLDAAGLGFIDWSALAGHYDSATGWLTRHAGSVKNLLTGQLPSAGSAAAGLVIGWIRG